MPKIHQNRRRALAEIAVVLHMYYQQSTSTSCSHEDYSWAQSQPEAVAVDIQLVNPLDDVVVFEVALTGDGLLGEAEFVLAPKETATYELVGTQGIPGDPVGETRMTVD